MSERFFGFNTTQAKTLEDLLAAVEAVGAANAALIAANTASIATNGTSITNLNAWGTALATKLNADAGVTDVNYDTTPQS